MTAGLWFCSDLPSCDTLDSQGQAFLEQNCLTAVLKGTLEASLELTLKTTKQLKTKTQKQEPYIALKHESVQILSVSCGCSEQINFYIWTPFRDVITVMQRSFHNHTLKGDNQDLLGRWIKIRSTKAIIPQSCAVFLFTSNSSRVINFTISSDSHNSIILNLWTTLIRHEGRIDIIIFY